MVCLAVILPGLIANSAQTKEAVLDGIVRAIAEKEPEWQGGKVHSMPGTPDPDRFRGTLHDFEWKRKDRTATLATLQIFYGDSEEDAVRMLEWSQMILSVNESEPLASFWRETKDPEGVKQDSPGREPWVQGPDCGKL